MSDADPEVSGGQQGRRQTQNKRDCRQIGTCIYLPLHLVPLLWIRICAWGLREAEGGNPLELLEVRVLLLPHGQRLSQWIHNKVLGLHWYQGHCTNIPDIWLLLHFHPPDIMQMFGYYLH